MKERLVEIACIPIGILVMVILLMWIIVQKINKVKLWQKK